MKIYYIYAKIPEKVYNERLKYLISNKHDFRWKHDYMYGMYAWTHSKKLCKEFLELRGDTKIYVLIEKDIDDKEEIHTMRKRYGELELGKYRFYYDENKDEEDSIQIVTTKNEYYESVDNAAENLYEFAPRPHKEVDYLLFNKEILNALDILGYVSAYDLWYGEFDDAYEREERVDKLLSLYERNTEEIVNKDSQANNLLYLFRFMFFGVGDKKISQEEVEDE